MNASRGHNAVKGKVGFQPLALAGRIAAFSRQNGDCIEWTGARGRMGHGRIQVKGRQIAAHRVNYERLVGPIPAGLHLDHLCRNPSCINPAHLEPVTPGENILRSPIAFTAVNARKAHCLRGHELTGANLKPNKLGERVCRACSRERTAAYRARKRLATGGQA